MRNPEAPCTSGFVRWYWEWSDPPPDLVLTGLVMPRIVGLAVLGAIRVHRPELPVVVMSGVAPAGYTSRALEEYRAPVISKPFSLEAICAAVRQALDEGRLTAAPGFAGSRRECRAPREGRRRASQGGRAVSDRSGHPGLARDGPVTHPSPADLCSGQ
jgi:DNA-binding NtrC family response regulator